MNLEQKVWWSYLEEDLQELLKEAYLLSEKACSWQEKFHDYSFVVFPAAKAYEGFLKKIFLDLGFIGPDDYYGKHFRIGKALNPSLDLRFRKKESVYDKLVLFLGSHDLADALWNTWKNARNLAFHWFPNEKNAVTLPEAKERLTMVVNSIDMAFKECKINKDNAQQNLNH